MPYGVVCRATYEHSAMRRSVARIERRLRTVAAIISRLRGYVEALYCCPTIAAACCDDSALEESVMPARSMLPADAVKATRYRGPR